MEWQGDCPCDLAFVEALSSGLPSEEDLQLLIQDTEEKLRLNACSIEQNLWDLQEKIGESMGGEKVASPAECLEWFSQGSLSSLKPISTSLQELRDFLKTLQHSLKTEEVCEEAVLRLLLSISSQCGVSFPCMRPLSPAPPPCAVRPDLALEVQDTWDDIRLLLRRHLLEKLQTAVATPGKFTEGRTGAYEKILLLQQLFFLFPKKEVLAKYQALQSKAVLGLLHSGRTSASGDGRGLGGRGFEGRGFEGLSQTFKAASPAFCSMLAEEIHVLSGVAEPRDVVDVLKGAYLGTLVQELASLMEREVEREVEEAALKGNTARSEKRPGSSSGKSAIAPQEAPGKGRSLLLTSHQLGGLVQLAATLLDMERSVKNLATVLGFPSCAGEDACREHAEDGTDPAVMQGKAEWLLPQTETVRLEFDWRTVFHQLAPHMTRSVELVLEHGCSRILHQQETTPTCSSTPIPLTSVPPARGAHLPCPERDMPKMVAKFCADVMEEMDGLLPLAVACEGHALLPVRSCYVEVCGRVTSALLARLEERARDVPASAPLGNLPALLASSVYVHQRLTHYETQLRDGGRVSVTLLPLGRSEDVVEALREHLTSYCVHVCGTSLLQDAEGHHWADPKPFYEGERCSFSIQMWHYFLCGLRSDLWQCLPPVLARDVLAQVLAQTLELLLQRYSRVQPSYGRLPQIRADVTAVLLGVHQLMWSVCGSVEELLTSEMTSGSWVAFIHSLCEQFLNVLVILTAPLPELYRTFQNGFDSSSISVEASKNSAPSWLSVINPTLFPTELLRGHGAGRASALRLLEAVSSGPGWGSAVLLGATLHADCLLPRTLIRHSHLCLDSEVEVSPEARQAAAEFVEAVFAVLSSLNSVPRALALVLEDYLDRRRLWEHFCDLAEPCMEEPVLFPCIRAVVSKPANCLLERVLNVTLDYEDLSSTPLRPDLPRNVLAKIPSEWKYIPQENKSKEAYKITQTIQALSFIFTHLPTTVASVPLPVRYLFHVAEKRLLQLGRQLEATGLLPWVLLSCLARGLKDTRSLELASTHPLERGAKELLALVSDCLQVSVGQQRGVTKPIIQKVLQNLEEKRPKWCSTQLQKARRFCEGGMFERVEGGLLDERGGPSEPTEQKMESVLLALCQGTGGSQNLRQIRRTIQLNEGLLRSILTSAEDGASSPQGLPPVLFPSSSSSSSSLSSSEQSTSPRPFNPFSHFHRIGQAEICQADLSERDWDWAQLLTSHQRMSQVTFTVLLANRWEMQDNAQLEGEEKILADHLKKMYLSGTSQTLGNA